MNNMNLISEGNSRGSFQDTISFFRPAPEKWKTKIKIFHETSPSSAFRDIEKEINTFLDSKDIKICDIKFNSRVDGCGEKIIVLLIYKERVE